MAVTEMTSRLSNLATRRNNSYTDGQIVEYLQANGSRSSRQLSEELGIEYTTVSPRMVVLVRKGLIHRDKLTTNASSGQRAWSYAAGGTPSEFPLKGLKEGVKRSWQPLTLAEINKVWNDSNHTLKGFVDGLNGVIRDKLGYGMGWSNIDELSVP